jgi:2-polyprenyl-3-methyl-5-hydroxy-6-metoxy-1,4-benzoquinol methylase
MTDNQTGICCQLCQSDSVQLIHDQPNSKYFPRKIHKCLDCGYAFVYPQPTKEHLEKVYSDSEYHKFSTNNNHKTQTINKGLLKRSRSRIRWLSKFITRGDVLDIGCAGGEFIYVANENGFNASGFDISENAVQFFNDTATTEIYTKSLEKLITKDIRFDILALWEVIEHVIDPGGFLEQCKQLLNPNGYIALSTPNQRNYHAIIHGDNWKGYIDGPEHLHFFNPGTLSSLLVKHDFKIMAIRTKRIAPVLWRWAAPFGYGNELEIVAKLTKHEPK